MLSEMSLTYIRKRRGPRTELLISKKHIQNSEKFQGKLCFQGKRKLLKILNVKSRFNTVKNFRATLFFQGKRKLLKNPERLKIF